MLSVASLPVLRTASIQPGEVLKSGGRNATRSRERITLRRALLVSQLAVSLVLVTAAMLFTRSLQNLRTLDPGFQPAGILIADLSFPQRGAISLRREILERLRALPEVKSVAETTIIPLTGADWNNRVWREGSDLAHSLVAQRTMIGADYFSTLQTRLLEGREFDQHDLASNVAVVNQEFAHEVIRTANAVEKHFWIEATPYDPQTVFEIVGVVKNGKHSDLRESFQPVMYLPLSEAALERPASRVLIRSSARPSEIVPGIRTALTALSPNIRYSFQIFTDVIQDSLLRERLMATLSGFFGVLAAILTAIGLYGAIAYAVAQRTNEIGIRMALGADRGAVIALILRETAFVLAIGLTAGTFFALAVSRTTATLLFGLGSNDPATLIAAAAALTIVALGASCLPAWRASSMNPVIALRKD